MGCGSSATAAGGTERKYVGPNNDHDVADKHSAPSGPDLQGAASKSENAEEPSVEPIGVIEAPGHEGKDVLATNVSEPTGEDERSVGDEIGSFETDGEAITIGSFKAEEGPAYLSGAREGWQLNLVETFKSRDNLRALGQLTRQGVLESPAALLTLEGVKLMFEPRDASNTCYSTCYCDMFDAVTCPTNCIELRWVTDGDGRHSPDSRWGVFALVTPDSKSTPDESVIESLADKWLSATQMARGPEGAISVEPEDWDESRLRALCARHGWQFEWMTEEGEKRRRIEGANDARRAAERAAKKVQGPSSAGGAAWWRLDSVVKAFAFGNNTQKPKIQPPPKPKHMMSDKVTQEGADPSVARVKPQDVKLQSKLR